MASTTFVDNQTVIYAAWLNDVNNAVYNGIFSSTSITSASMICTGTASGSGFTNLINNTFSAPAAIGSATPNTGKFTTLQTTSTTTLGGATSATSISATSLSLSTALPIASGGTGLTSSGTSGYVLGSNGSAFVASAPFGLAQTWQSPTRTSGTQYTNSTNLPIQVAFYLQSSSTSTISAVVGGITIFSGTNPSSTYITFIVPVGGTYTIIWNNASSQSWSELR